MFALLPAMFHVMEKQHWTSVFTMFTHEIDEHEIQPTKTRKHKEITIPFCFGAFMCPDVFHAVGFFLSDVAPTGHQVRWHASWHCGDLQGGHGYSFGCFISLLGHVWTSLSSTCGIVKYIKRERDKSSIITQENTEVHNMQIRVWLSKNWSAGSTENLDSRPIWSHHPVAGASGGLGSDRALLGPLWGLLLAPGPKACPRWLWRHVEVWRYPIHSDSSHFNVSVCRFQQWCRLSSIRMFICEYG